MCHPIFCPRQLVETAVTLYRESSLCISFLGSYRPFQGSYLPFDAKPLVKLDAGLFADFDWLGGKLPYATAGRVVMQFMYQSTSGRLVLLDLD